MTVSLVLRCSGCAAFVDLGDPVVASRYRCPNTDRAPTIDHVLTWNPVAAGVDEWPTDSSTNPFIRYRTLQHGYWLNRARGATDADHVAFISRFDSALGTTGVGESSGGQAAGAGFRVTPLQELTGDAASALGVAEVWAKIETRNVSGSHKARHLFAILTDLELRRTAKSTPLALASCGNAAIAAATLARAARRVLDVYVPTWISPSTRERLAGLGARIHECGRISSDPPGDPCIHRFHEALARGAVPFCVQGPENGLTIDGGATLGYELADQFAMLGFVPDRLFVQTGGGALGSSVVRGLGVALGLGAIASLPKLHFVQAQGCAPLHRAWRFVATRALRSLYGEESATASLAEAPDDVVAHRLHQSDAAPAVAEALSFAVTHRSSAMWPWEDEPRSVATGLLDDETYDWFALLGAMFATGGWPIVVSDDQIVRALSISCPDVHADDCCDADPTGVASLAGAVALSSMGLLASNERICTLVTGAKR